MSSLEKAIATASAERLRAVLTRIIKTNAEAKAIAQSKLLTTHASDTTLKRKRYEVCEKCHAEYDVTSNRTGDCVYHDGDKKVHSESATWEDHDDDCHGDPDTLVDDPDYADGFIWNCCDRGLTEPGCISTKHKAADSSKRARA